MKTINFTKMGNRQEILHIETDLGIVNIHVNLMNANGQRVEAIELIPNNYSSDPKVNVDGSRIVRFIEEKRS